MEHISRGRRSFILAMLALFVLVAIGDTYPWHALAATGALLVLWLVIDLAKRWWKSGTAKFAKIMDEELSR